MKQFSLLFLISFLFLKSALGQSKHEENALNDYVGNYYAKIDPVTRFVIRKEKEELTMEIVGQGRVQLSRIGKDRFSVSRVRPKLIIEFKRDSAGNTIKFKWIQTVPKYSFTRITPPIRDSSLNHAQQDLSKYTGNYRLTINRYKILQVRAENDYLTVQGTNEGKLILTNASGNRFLLSDIDLRIVYDFIPDANGNMKGIEFSRTGTFDCLKTEESFGTPDVVYGFNRPNGFTRADSLRGRLTPLRTCYDVLFYDLNVSVDPETKTVSGNNTIRFKAVNSFDQMQVDLFANMKIEKILFHNTAVSYAREFNAIFVHLPSTVKEGTTEEINIIYSGKPQTPDASSLAGGIFWLQDKEGQYWIETVTQGSGASLWWPCKDHLSDKPDSMKISVTVPRGLTEISNGRLARKTESPNNTRFDWVVSYPITNYCVAMNIGNYAHFSDVFVTGRDTLPLNYYCMSYNLNIANKIF